jgi:predicted acylesterase/phospholipase RssA
VPYDIELMSIGEDSYPLLDRCSDKINRIQDQFRFHLTAVPHRQSGIAFRRSRYLTSDIWDFLRDHRTKFGGHRPYIIAFVTTPLASSKLTNLFGSHEATEGLACVTTFGAAQYVREESRYCCYYLVRYALSFVNPLIKSHTDEARKNCYFHSKIYKKDIRGSMDSGYICDSCMEQLDKPPPGSTAHQLSEEEREALRKLRLFVSDDLPYAIVMKGGGVKGLAFAGALKELEKHFWFNRHVGTSAGAIAAVLLAAAYTPAELKDLLLQKDFCDFMDASAWRLPFNLLFRQGLYPGEAFRAWVARLLSAKINILAEVTMATLNGALIYATRRGTGTLVFDSLGQRSDAAAAYAVRCSMSIPIFFVPAEVDGRRVFDGGLRNNFPLKRFLDTNPRSQFIALYLGKPDYASRRWIGSELLDIFIEGEEREAVDQNRANVVVIDTSPVGTVDFRLTDEEKQFLLKVGKAAALRFLYERKLDNGPSQEDVAVAHEDAETSRAAVRQLRARRRARSLFRVVCVILVLAALFWFHAFGFLAKEYKSIVAPQRKGGAQTAAMIAIGNVDLGDQRQFVVTKLGPPRHENNSTSTTCDDYEFPFAKLQLEYNRDDQLEFIYIVATTGEYRPDVIGRYYSGVPPEKSCLGCFTFGAAPVDAKPLYFGMSGDGGEPAVYVEKFETAFSWNRYVYLIQTSEGRSEPGKDGLLSGLSEISKAAGHNPFADDLRSLSATSHKEMMDLRRRFRPNAFALARRLVNGVLETEDRTIGYADCTR